MAVKKYFAVANGRETGIFFAVWDDIEGMVKGFPRAKFKAFTNKLEAEKYMKLYGAQPPIIAPPKVDPFVYVDSGASVLPTIKNASSAESVSPIIRTASSVPPTIRTASSVPPTIRTASSVPPTIRTASSVPPTIRTASKSASNSVPHESDNDTVSLTDDSQESEDDEIQILDARKHVVESDDDVQIIEKPSLTANSSLTKRKIPPSNSTTSNSKRVKPFNLYQNYNPKYQERVIDEFNPSKIHIFTDGSCLKNGTRHAKAGYGVYFGPNDPRNVSSKLDGPDQTNNRAELMAVIVALEKTKTELEEQQPVVIYSDSSYMKNGITVWIHSWKRNGWKTADGGHVKNKDLWLRLDKLYSDRRALIEFVWVRGHDGILGNEMADQLARMGAEQ